MPPWSVSASASMPPALVAAISRLMLRLAVEQAVLGMDVQVGEIGHSAPP